MNAVTTPITLNCAHLMTTSDAHIIGDVVIANIIAAALRLIVMEAFIKPAAIWAGRRGWHILDWALGGRLPDLK
jgi:hypothetical protein